MSKIDHSQYRILCLKTVKIGVDSMFLDVSRWIKVDLNERLPYMINWQLINTAPLLFWLGEPFQGLIF